MYCKNCGALLSDGARFCKNCGQPIKSAASPVPEIENSSVAASKQESESTSKQSFASTSDLVIKPTTETTPESKPEPTPEESAPKPTIGQIPESTTPIPDSADTVSVPESKSYSKYEKQNTSQKPKGKAPSKRIVIILFVIILALAIGMCYFLFFTDSAIFDLRPVLGLSSNEDTNDNGEGAKGTKEEIDVFSDLMLEFTGVEPDGKVKIIYEGNDFSESDFTCDPADGLSNGDKVTVSIDPDAVEKFERDENKSLKDTTREYTVKGLDTGDAAEKTGEEDSPEDEEYLIPDSDTRLITYDDLEGFTADDCKLARNELYARHGRRFKDADLQAYFDSKSWYIGTIKPDDWNEGMLSDIEMQNRDTIVNFEKEKGYR